MPEDQKRVKDDIENRTGRLRDHGAHGVAGGNQKLFKVLTEKGTRRYQADHGQVLRAVLDDLGHIRLHGIVGSYTESPHQHKKDGIAGGEHHSHVGDAEGLAVLPLTGVAGHQRIDRNPGAHADGGDDLL